MKKERKKTHNSKKWKIIIAGILVLVISIFVVMSLIDYISSNSMNSKKVSLKTETNSRISSMKYSQKINTNSWKRYFSQSLGISLKYLSSWHVDEFSQEGSGTILLFDSPDVKSENTLNGGGIEIVLYKDDLHERIAPGLPVEQYIKEKMHTVSPYSETIYENSYHSFKFHVSRGEGLDGLEYFVVPYKTEIFEITIRYTDKNRRNEAEDIADAMINSMIISPK